MDACKQHNGLSTPNGDTASLSKTFTAALRNLAEDDAKKDASALCANKTKQRRTKKGTLCHFDHACVRVSSVFDKCPSA